MVIGLLRMSDSGVSEGVFSVVVAVLDISLFRDCCAITLTLESQCLKLGLLEPELDQAIRQIPDSTTEVFVLGLC